MNKLAIMQPYLFPYIGYWQLINTVDSFLVYDSVNYIKGGWINRNNILLNGSRHMFTLPLASASPFLPIDKIYFFNKIRYINKLTKSVEQAYKKAPFYNDVMPIFHSITQYDDDLIANFIFNSIEELSAYLGISTKLFRSSLMKKDESLRGQEQVIDICKKFNTSEYINAIGGLKLYSKETFKQHGIDLQFIKTQPIFYKQFENDFVPFLSIFDVLMFNGKENTKKLLCKYTLL